CISLLIRLHLHLPPSFSLSLSGDSKEDYLREYFSKFGSVSQFHLVVDRDIKQLKGILCYKVPGNMTHIIIEVEKPGTKLHKKETCEAVRSLMHLNYILNQVTFKERPKLKTTCLLTSTSINNVMLSLSPDLGGVVTKSKLKQVHTVRWGNGSGRVQVTMQPGKPLTSA
ncbi:hypothetical protein M8C21_009839, partial [Ambrosia artemisiifolia]